MKMRARLEEELGRLTYIGSSSHYVLSVLLYYEASFGVVQELRKTQ